MENANGKRSFLERVEVLGNSLPHPITLFGMLAILTVIASGILSYFDVSVLGEALNEKGELVENVYKVKSLVTREGFSYMLTNTVKNFAGYAPLGVVMVAMFGVGVADLSGYLTALLKRVLAVIPDRLVIPMLVFAGIMANIAGDAGYVVLIPLGMMLAYISGRHPFAGFAAAMAGVAGGFSANLLITINDALLAPIATEAARIVSPSYEVYVASNWYFMIVSTFVLTIVGTIIIEKIVEPRLGKYEGGEDLGEDHTGDLSPREQKALKRANWVFIIAMLFFVACAIPDNSFMRNAKTGSLVISSPLMNGIVSIVALVFLVVGITYGYGTGRYKNDKDVCKDLGKAMSSMGMFLALAVVASQFIKYFNYTGIGAMISVAGANFLSRVNVHYSVILLLFILFCGFMNLLMSSASAKFILLAPIFVPMLMRVGLAPELTMAAYRIADSAVNPISPVFTYLALTIAFVQKYDKDAGIGTIWSLMLPIAVSFLLIWTALLFVFVICRIPLGPGVECFLSSFGM